MRNLDPLPTVPALIAPLGPAPARLVPPEPTWQEFIQSMCPVRELMPGDRPREWVEGANDSGASSPEDDRKMVGAGESDGESESDGQSDGKRDGACDQREEPATVTTPEREDPTTHADEGHNDAILERPERYKVHLRRRRSTSASSRRRRHCFHTLSRT